MKKLFLTILLLLFTAGLLRSQQCQNDSTGLIPINDLGMSLFNGKFGGLYGNGQNQIPPAHLQAGIEIASQIVPLDVSGNPNPNGSVVMISIGMSNANQYFSTFRDSSLNYPALNPKLKQINCAFGGKDIDNLIDTNDSYWTMLSQRLSQAQSSHDQVQVVWFLQAKHILGIPPNQGVEHIEIMEQKFLTAFQILKRKFPNLKQIFCSGRDYGGYSNPNQGNPEPYAYYTGWSFRLLLERQMNGDTNLTYSGQNSRTAWLAWAGYIWADGKNPRSDGFRWLCPEDFQPDGVHPSAIGRAKVAHILMNFFKSDTTSVWFRDRNITSVTNESSFVFEPFNLTNPTSGFIEIPIRGENLNVQVYNIIGQLIFSSNEPYINITSHPSGMYVVQIFVNNQRYVQKLLKR